MDPSILGSLHGHTVQISRSDGRIHSSVVKSVDEAKGAVMVEWTERNATKRKEVDFEDLCAHNKELLLHLSSLIVKETPTMDKKYNSRLRSSRIPAPPIASVPAAVVAEQTVSRASTRQTCMFVAPLQPTLPQPTPSNTALPSTGTEAARKVRKEGGASNRPCEEAKENEEGQDNVGVLRGPRASIAPKDKAKPNKRLSGIAKPPDAQTKKGKFGEVPRPNQKFYEMIQEFRETLDMNPPTHMDDAEDQKICVCIRKRPFNNKELARREIDVVSVTGNGTVLVHEPKTKVDLTKYLENQEFHFDYSFDENTTNEMVYRFTAKPLVKSIFDGAMATCFAYGQTGSGKTHTMGGDFSGKRQNSTKGIYALAAQDVFTLINSRRYACLDLNPYVAFFEIYNGKVYDLLNNKAQLRVLEDERHEVQVVGLQEVEVSAADDVIKIIELGSACRTSGQTSANANSSRSHAILQIVLRNNNRAKTLHGKFSLIDLAGNERGTDVSNSSDRATMVETTEINRSLLALKECIRSLGRNGDHVPFRLSTLTKVLRDSFIGDKSRTCMIALLSPSMASCDYTMNTLRYADRVKELNGPKARRTAKAAEPMESTSEEEEEEDSIESDPYALVTELEDKVQGEIQRFSEVSQRAKEVLEPMRHISYDVEVALPDLLDYARCVQEYSSSLQAAVEALQAAVEEEQASRLPKTSGSRR